MIPAFTKRQSIVILIVLACVVVSLILRVLPWFQMNFELLAIHGDPDVWYNFRQIEVMVSDFPRYNWFDPMTAYPVGKNVDWGPLFPIIASAFSIVAGASQRGEFLAVSSWVPVIFGIVMIPVVFFIGRQIAGWKAGVIAAVFIAFISGEYFYRTMAGVVDHHCAEIFFTTLFCLFFIYTIRKASEIEVNLKNPVSLKPILIPSLIAGISLAAGLAVMPTSILFAMIVAVYTLAQYIWDVFHGKRTDYLLVVNGVVSACAIAVFALIGIHSPLYTLSSYSAAPVHAFILLFSGTLLLQVFSLAARAKPWIFIALVIVSLLGALGVASLVSPSIVSSGIDAVSTFFGQSFKEFPIDEQKPWSLTQMWASYNIGIILAFIGLIVLAYRFRKKECPAHLFVLIWGLIVIIATIQHSRFEYYSAVIVAVSSAAGLGYAFSLDEPGKAGKTNIRPVREQKGKKEKKKRERPSRSKTSDDIFSSLEGTGTSFVLACMVIFCGISLLSDYSITTTTKDNLIPPQWTGVLEWMEGTTPDPGMPYLGPYPETGWVYPPEAYGVGVLSWWDYGHWITFISKRIPVTNPFQDNIVPSSAYFFAESEETANGIADNYGIKYIITDWKMVESKFPAMVAWYNSSLDDHSVPENYYYQVFSSPGEIRGNQTLVMLYKTPYYQTMVSRLHNFDGSMTSPSMVVYVEYEIAESLKGIPAVSVYQILGPDAAREKLARFESSPSAGMGAAVINTGLDSPVETVGALRHYRLIYEQAGTEQNTSPVYAQSVKVFEYVRGARLKGDGVIEVTIRTNLGRTFVYRQESENGFFILPYATQGSAYPVKTVGSYRILPSGMTFEVTEEDILEGKIIVG